MPAHRRLTRPILGALVALALVAALPGDTLLADISPLELFTARVDAATLDQLAADGFDITDAVAVGDEFQLDLVLAGPDRDLLEKRGIALTLWRDPAGRTALELADAQQQQGFKVWRSFDAPGGIRDEIYQLAKDYPAIAKVEVVGTSRQDREILALRLTKDVQTTPEGARPAVLYSSLQHAREWIGLEVNRRLLHHLVDHYGKDAAVTRLVDTRDLWFLLVANPDGYQMTFQGGRRLWRKTAWDMNGDGTIANGEGIDPNRNFAERWNYDIEGSSGSPTSDTYRGSGPASEPETQAMQGLLLRGKDKGWKFTFQVNYHSVAGLLLYGVGWQVQTRVADDPIMVAMSGIPERPAIPRSLPQLSASLYITNGETCDFAYAQAGTMCWTPELSDQDSGGGFVFPDDEALVQKEFEENLPFALDVAESAPDPAHPVSHLGNTVAPFYIDPFPVSYGDPQTVQVNAARRLGPVTMRFRVNDGAEQAVATREWEGGERFGAAGDLYYHFVRGEVKGARPGDRVTVWFTAGDARSDPFTYTVAVDSGAPVLVVAAEDYTGSAPIYAKTDGPTYLQAYLDALQANEIPADVYDVDARGRQAPHPLGVLSHYRAVVWYTGDDFAPRAADGPPSTVARSTHAMELAVRAFLNEGGKVLYTGKYAGYPYFQGYLFDDHAGGTCNPEATGETGCEQLSNDFLQYWFGAYSYTRSNGAPVDVANRAGTGGGWWSQSASRLDNTLGRSFDLTAAQAPVTFAFDSLWRTEVDYDYGYVEASTDGGATWQNLQDLDGLMTNANPNNVNLGWGVTGVGQGRLRFDLSAYAGQTVAVRLRYVTDPGANLAGWFVDNVALDDATGRLFADDGEGAAGGWTDGGWRTVPYRPVAADYTPGVATHGGVLGDLSVDFGPAGTGNQDHAGLFLPTSRPMPPDTYPQFTSAAAGWLRRPADMPHGGDHHVASGYGSLTYSRLMRTVDVSERANGRLAFWISHDLSANGDAVIVEAHTVGQDDWTTLPDENGHTSPQTALFCANAGWFGRHPHLAHYLTRDTSGQQAQCRGEGTTGKWNAATGRSGGWQAWSVDLSAYAGKTVELSISVIRSTQTSLGAYVDDVVLAGGDPASFEADLGGWTAAGPPDGSPANTADFRRATLADFPLGTVVQTEDTLLFGFGIEGIPSAELRATLLGRALAYLLPPMAEGKPAVFLPWAENGSATP